MKPLFQTVMSAVLTCGIAFTNNAQNVIETESRSTVFAEGIVSTPYYDWSTSFTPDGKTVYFSQGITYFTSCFSKMIHGKWSKPQIATFSGKWNDVDPFISIDGKRVIFISNRPLPGMPQNKPNSVFHLWYVNYVSKNVWSEPHYIGEPVNLPDKGNYAPSMNSAGDLYFCARGREGHVNMSVYCAKWLGDHYDQPQYLNLAGEGDTRDPFIAPDNSYLIFVYGRDIYICFHEGGSWSKAQKLGPEVNNSDANSAPAVSRDGKVLYYTSARKMGLNKLEERGLVRNYDLLIREMQTFYNGNGNILMIPINLYH